MNSRDGVFMVSLDFELYWGMRDKRSIEEYQWNLLGVRNVVPALLQLFGRYNIHATWATVGFLFLQDVSELSAVALGADAPQLRPSYENQDLSPYRYLESETHLESVYHFAPDLIDSILCQEGQEIGTHTFSHYYCLEKGQTPEQFRADVQTAIDTARRRGVEIRSFVFPRNQWNPAYLSVLKDLGLQCYRGNERSWIYRASDGKGQNALRRALRLADAYCDLTGPNTHATASCLKDRPFNFPSSRYLRPYSRRFRWLERFRLDRIRNAMSDAAVSGRLFHLWWHPHDFGVHTEENMRFLNEIVQHYDNLKNRYGMKSLNMGELAEWAEEENE